MEMDGTDERVPLLPPPITVTAPVERERERERGESEDDGPLAELFHSVGSFAAVVLPVTLAMALSSLAAVWIKDPSLVVEQSVSEYLVYKERSGAASGEEDRGEEIARAAVNALVIVSFIALATFAIVCCYKMNCMRLLVGYMVLSCVTLLGFMGGYISLLVLDQLHLTVDTLTFGLLLYNFAVVGITAIFYQKGLSVVVTQSYLVLISVIMAWQLSQLPEWTTWALLLALAFYDLCAVLSPCGPLRWLIAEVQAKGQPLPGLLYEADVNLDALGGRQGSGRSALPLSTPGQPTPMILLDSIEDEEKERDSEDVQRGRVVTITEQRLDELLLQDHPSLTPERRLRQFYRVYNPANINSVPAVLALYQGREDVLWQHLKQKYLEKAPYQRKDDDVNTIKLGLGDFIFYSVLVARAALYNFIAFASCLIAIIMGLGSTLLLLGLYRQALPALPISICLAAFLYFLSVQLTVPYVHYLQAEID